MTLSLSRTLFLGIFTLALLGGCADEQIRLGLQRAALTAPSPTSDAEAMFAEAYRLEQRADFGHAAQYYNVVVDRYPSSPLAEIAKQRLAGLSSGDTTAAAAAADPATLAAGDYACTIEGLYPNQARWCGLVRQVRTPYFLVEVTDVHLNSLMALWFSRSTCTGNQMLTWFSRGNQVWVPSSCLGIAPVPAAKRTAAAH
jgi:hypothetical protein